MEAKRAEREKEKPNCKPDDGEWFRIAHEIYRALYSTREMDKTQIKMMHWCIHKTWGVKGRRSFIFTTAEAAKELGLDKAQIRRAKDTLIEANMLIKVDKDGNEIRVNKYPDNWDVGILQGKRAADTQRRKSYEAREEDTSPPISDDEGGGYVPPRGRIRPPSEEDTSPPSSLKPLQDADRSNPLDKIDKSIDKTTTTTGQADSFDEHLAILQSVKGYPFDEDSDWVMLKKLAEMHPKVDLLSELKGWSIYKLDQPIKKGDKPRGQINNWMKKAANPPAWKKDNTPARRTAKEVMDDLERWAAE